MRLSFTHLMLCALIALAVLVAVAMFAAPAPVLSRASLPASLSRAASRIERVSGSAAAAFAGDIRQLMQTEDEGGEDAPEGGVSPEQLQKYVAVYRAMQRNHALTIEQAAASQGLTVPAFRDLEQRIESDDLARDDARRALAAPSGQATAVPNP
ncbi:MAG TPA: hypothetical protein VKT27_12830 [Candidatus Binataceae bacterium]|nr:hypothetical protein [Candidatus Binataceae bacterium]